jgi:hypothetical protein
MTALVRRKYESVMLVFLSWSGARSHAVARAFREWLPRIIQALKPWLSSEDIGKGSTWGDELKTALEQAQGVGVFFVTREALSSHWLLYEAGTIGALGKQRVCVVRVGLEKHEIVPPLGNYQSSGLDRDDVLKLVSDLNQLVAPPISDAVLLHAFNAAWPQLQRDVSDAIAQTEAPVSIQAKPGQLVPPPPASPESGIAALLAVSERIEARLGALEERVVSGERLTRAAVARTMNTIVGNWISAAGGPARKLGVDFLGSDTPLAAEIAAKTAENKATQAQPTAVEASNPDENSSP